MNENNERIKKLRKDSGLSQNKFAQKFHISVQTLQKWEQNINNAPDHIIWLLETITDCESKGYVLY